MEFFSEWITNIILFVLLAVIVELLLPQSAMQKYVKMVLGLLLILIILSPIMKLLSTDVDEWLHLFDKTSARGEVLLEKEIENQKLEIQAQQHAYILKEMSDKLKELVEKELMEQYGLAFKEISFELKNDELQTYSNMDEFLENLQVIHVVFTPEEKSTIEPVEAVTIEIGRERDEKDQDQQDAVRYFLAKQWGVEEELIEIFVDGGDA